jgi:LacI family transcriptional regulator
VGDAHPARRVTLAHVAARAGTSQATASRALAGDRRISEATRRAVGEAAEVLGYVPNVAARSLRARRTRTLGLLLSDLRDPVHGQVAAGFEEEAVVAGYTVIIVATGGRIEEERRALRVFVERRTDGICVASSVMDPTEAMERVGSGPLVIVQPDHPCILQAADALPPGTLRTDDASGMEQAADHLLAAGHRRIAYLGPGEKATDILRRSTAQRVLHERGGVELRVGVVPEDAWERPGEVAGALGQDPPHAVLCYDDKLALALLDGLRARGLRVPDDVAVVGYDGIPFAALANPRLTTVSTPTAEMGGLAARWLLDAVGSGSLAPARLLPVALAVRESSVRRARTTGRRREPVMAGRG